MGIIEDASYRARGKQAELDDTHRQGVDTGTMDTQQQVVDMMRAREAMNSQGLASLYSTPVAEPTAMSRYANPDWNGAIEANRIAQAQADEVLARQQALYPQSGLASQQYGGM